MIRSFREINYNELYYWLLILLAASLPLSPFITSLSQFMLGAVWLLEGKYRTKINRLIRQKELIIFLGIYLVHVAGMIYSSDLSYGFHDLKIKIPLFILPFIIGTIDPLNSEKVNRILYFFVASVIVATFISFAYYLGFGGFEYTDIREISIIISHIRFSLQIAFSIIIILYILVKKHRILNIPGITLLCLSVAWLFLFLMLFQVMTGIVVFYLSLILFLIRMSVYLRKRYFTIAGAAISVLIVFHLAHLIIITADQFYHIEKVDRETIEQYTSKGNRYKHNFKNKRLENGNYVWLYVCEKELSEAWNKRGKIDFHGKDKKNQNLKYTLIRYMTSKGLKKDAEGIWKLTDEDIKNVEAGHTNYKYTGKFGIRKRIYQTLWEIDNYRKGGNPSFSSVVQRYVYLKAALNIIRNNFWIGTGTGDVDRTYQEYYERSGSPLEKTTRLRAHNQYITVFVTFGITGFTLFIFMLLYPVIKRRKQLGFIFYIFFFIVCLSMLNEDTFETQAGITFFAFFYSLFVFGQGRYAKSQGKNDL